MNPRCRRCWTYWAVASASTFTYLELRGWRRQCHRTLSRELRQLLGLSPPRDWGRYGALLPAAAGIWLSHHLISLKDVEARCDDHP